jgi:hypothetical protein
MRMNISENAGSSWMMRIMAAFSTRMISASVMAVAVAMLHNFFVEHGFARQARDRNEG